MQSSRWWCVLLLTGLLLPAMLRAQEQTLTGVVRSAAAPGTPLVLEVPGQTQQLNLPAAGVMVMRNGMPAGLTELQRGDQVTLTLGPENVVLRVDATGGAPPVETTSGVVVGTITRNTGGQLVLMTMPGGEREFTIPSNATIVREGRDTQLAAIALNDSVVLMLNSDGGVASIFAQPLGNEYVVEGRTTGMIGDRTLEVEVGEQTIQVPLPIGDEAQITRDGDAVGVDKLAADDRVQIRFNPLGRPVEIIARSAGRGSLLGSPWLLLLCLVPLLLLGLAILRGVPLRDLFVLPSRRQPALDADDFDGVGQP
jgi:hypothetical protein